ncbi:MAG TPA: restriction endonuclease subunit S [Bacteroidales bacterium]|nr:restriction endonuclease subunit S [Bacteroidales bacterium]
MSEWKTYTLGKDVVTKLGDGLHGTPIYDDNGEYYFINGSNLVEGKIVINSNTKRVTEEEFIKYKKDLSDKTILLGINGTIGNVALYNNEMCILGKSAAYLNINDDFDKQFVRYVLTNDHFQNYIKNNASGTTIKNVGLGLLREYEFSAPEDKEQQQEIAKILTSLDDKIELNLQMNQTLEAMAQALFKEWFINFNFPNFDGELDNGLPKGWKMGRLSDLCIKITKGTTPTTLKKQFTSEGVNFIKVESINEVYGFIPEKFAFIDDETNELLKRSKIEENDILFTIAGTLGRIAIADKSILPANTNQAVAIIRCSSIDYINYVLFLLKSNLFLSTITSKAVHAVQANISLGVISDTEIVIPTIETLIEFNNAIKPLMKKMIENNYQIQTITQTRDTLLPKLMNGQISLNL